jgi:hypothetical protein
MFQFKTNSSKAERMFLFMLLSWRLLPQALPHHGAPWQQLAEGRAAPGSPSLQFFPAPELAYAYRYGRVRERNQVLCIPWHILLHNRKKIRDFSI